MAANAASAGGAASFSLPHLIASRLASLLTIGGVPLIRNLDRSQLSIGWWKGDLLLEDLTVNVAAFNALLLPVALRAARIGRLRVKIPWKRLLTSPIVVVVDGVVIEAEHPDGAAWTPEALARARELLVRALAKPSDEPAAPAGESTSAADSPDSAGAGSGDSRLLSWRMIATVLTNLVVDVQRVHISYSAPSGAGGAGLPAFTIGVSLDGLALRSAAGRASAAGANPAGSAGWDMLVDKRLELSRLAVHVSEGIRQPRDDEATLERVLHPLTLACRLIAKPNARSLSGVPRLQLELDGLTELRVSVSEEQLLRVLAVLMCLRDIGYWAQMCAHRPAKRPHAGTGSARAWWAYAGALARARARATRRAVRYDAWAELWRTYGAERDFVRLAVRDAHAQRPWHHAFRPLEDAERELLDELHRTLPLRTLVRLLARVDAQLELTAERCLVTVLPMVDSVAARELASLLAPSSPVAATADGRAQPSAPLAATASAGVRQHLFARLSELPAEFWRSRAVHALLEPALHERRQLFHATAEPAPGHAERAQGRMHAVLEKHARLAGRPSVESAGGGNAASIQMAAGGALTAAAALRMRLPTVCVRLGFAEGDALELRVHSLQAQCSGSLLNAGVLFAADLAARDAALELHVRERRTHYCRPSVASAPAGDGAALGNAAHARSASDGGDASVHITTLIALEPSAALGDCCATAHVDLRPDVPAAATSTLNANLAAGRRPAAESPKGSSTAGSAAVSSVPIAWHLQLRLAPISVLLSAAPLELAACLVARLSNARAVMELALEWRFHYFIVQLGALLLLDALRARFSVGLHLGGLVVAIIDGGDDTAVGNVQLAHAGSAGRRAASAAGSKGTARATSAPSSATLHVALELQRLAITVDGEDGMLTLECPTCGLRLAFGSELLALRQFFQRLVANIGALARGSPDIFPSSAAADEGMESVLTADDVAGGASAKSVRAQLRVPHFAFEQVAAQLLHTGGLTWTPSGVVRWGGHTEAKEGFVGVRERAGSWKRAYAVLHGESVLNLFDDFGSTCAADMVPLRSSSSYDTAHVHFLSDDGAPFAFGLDVGDRKLIFCASSHAERVDWVTHLRRAAATKPAPAADHQATDDYAPQAIRTISASSADGPGARPPFGRYRALSDPNYGDAARLAAASTRRQAQGSSLESVGDEHARARALTADAAGVVDEGTLRAHAAAVKRYDCVLVCGDPGAPVGPGELLLGSGMLRFRYVGTGATSTFGMASLGSFTALSARAVSSTLGHAINPALVDPMPSSQYADATPTSRASLLDIVLPLTDVVSAELCPSHIVHRTLRVLKRRGHNLEFGGFFSGAHTREALDVLRTLTAMSSEASGLRPSTHPSQPVSGQGRDLEEAVGMRATPTQPALNWWNVRC